MLKNINVFARSDIIFFIIKYFFLFFFFFAPVAYAKIDISFESSSYLSKFKVHNSLNQYFNIGFKLELYSNSDALIYGLDALTVRYIDASQQRYLAVPNLFVMYRQFFENNYKFSVILGRQEGKSYTGVLQYNKNPQKTVSESWSILDEIWDLGLWQSRINWDYLQTQQQGLIGSFFTIEKEQWLITLFLSGFFLPDHTSSIDITEGVILSKSRWFIPSQSEFNMFNQRIEAFYWLKKPYVKNVVLNDSIATRFRFGSDDNQWISIAYAKKPVNQIYFKIDSGFSINDTSVKSIIYYQSFTHSLMSIDLGFKRDIFKTIVSVTREVPRRPQVPNGWIVPILPKALFLSSYMELNLKKYRFPVELMHVKYLYSHFIALQSNSKNGMDTSLALDLNINRFKLYHGVAVSAYSRVLEWKQQSFLIGVSYWYSIPEKGGWLNSVLTWYVSPQWRIESKIDILGAENSKKQSFFNSYRHNDRIKIKVVYVFH